MINIKPIINLDYQYCWNSFKELFNYEENILENDKANIYNFLTIDYKEAERQFLEKLSCLKTLDEIIFFIYDKNNQLVGYSTIFTSRWGNSINELELGIFIRKQDRSKGYGSEVIAYLEEFIRQNLIRTKKIALCPFIQNEKAIKLYKKLGYDYESNSMALAYGFIYMIKDL
jgi:RimJ/RimL family protein N-acetyltransferase